MESTPSRKTIKGFRKVPQFQDIMEVELKNAKKTMDLPFRYTFLANHTAEAANEHEKKLDEHHGAVMREFKDHYDSRSGGTPLVVREVVQGERGVQGEQGVQGPAGPSINLDPVIREMQSRLDEAEVIRTKARDQELQEELSRMRTEQARQTETARVLAQMQANLTSIPSEVRAVAEAHRNRSNIDATTHIREAAAHLGQQTQNNHEASMQFLRRNMTDLAGFAVQMGGSLSRAMDRFKEEPMQVTPPPPPPPPPPSGARIKIAEKKALPPHKPPGSMPGSSNDPPPPPSGDFRFGSDGKTPPAKKKKKSEMELMADEYDALDKADKAKPKPKAKPKAAPTLVKQKTKKNQPVGLKKDIIIPEHDTKLTPHGLKPRHNTKPALVPQGPEPESDVKITEYGGKQWKRKGAPPPPQTTILRKRPLEAGRPTKRLRRVSAHEI